MSITFDIPLADRTKLNLGSGNKYDPEAVNLDVTRVTKPDVVHNLDVFPYPFPDNRFSEIEMRDVLEHLADTVKVLEELHRILRPNGRAKIIVPHFSSNGAYADPTHRRFFAAGTFEYFTNGHPNSFYTPVRFRIVSLNIVFRPTLINKLVWRLANRFPKAYEENWAWRFPAWFLGVVLEAEK